MRQLNYKHLHYFWAVAHQGNLTRAAENLNVSQSALSIQIQKLEEQLGHDLFERRGRQLILTEVGAIVLEHANQIFNIGDELQLVLKDRGAGSRPTLRVGGRATLSRNFQMKFLEPLLRREDVKVILKSGSFADLIEDLETHKIDVVLSNVLPLRDAKSTWVPHVIEEQPVSLVGHKKFGNERVDWREVVQQAPLILPSTESGIRSGFDSLLERSKVTPRVVAESDDMAMMRLLIREGVGVGVVPPIVVRHELKQGTLAVLADLPDIVETFFAITLSRLFPNVLLDEVLNK